MSMFNQNAILKGIKPSGDLEAYIDAFKDLIPKNSGKRHVDQVCENARNQQAPIPFNQFTTIPLTSTQFMVSNIRKGFMTARFASPISMTGLNPNLAVPIGAAGTAGDVDKLVKIFIGFKSSRQCIEEIVLLQDGVPTNYHDKYIVQEGFVDAALRPWASKRRHWFVETLYENVVQYMPDVCGTNVNAADF
jgi:hypothetical protein